MASYAEVATSPKVLDKVAEQFGLSTTSVELADSIEADVSVDTVIIEIAATDPNRVRLRALPMPLPLNLPRLPVTSRPASLMAAKPSGRPRSLQPRCQHLRRHRTS
jgi:hypothetical protein